MAAAGVWNSKMQNLWWKIQVQRARRCGRHDLSVPKLRRYAKRLRAFLDRVEAEKQTLLKLREIEE